MWEYLVVAVDEVPGARRSPHQPEEEIRRSQGVAVDQVD